ncbi:MAG TPA: serine--tRNA ligase, partial [Nitrosospira sp.]|nr:serine--tRNA ligase [Nitrosospira sp.]
MLDIQLLRINLENVARILATRGYSFPITEFETLEAERKSVQTYTQELQARRNSVSKQIGNAKSKGEDVTPLLADVANLGEELRLAETRLQRIQAELRDMLMHIPNLPHASVPLGH